ncbi:MAG: ATP-binding cassette domain-containing protein [Collinsella sp.]|nr:ATP-binding cassette domain-containing protein [Collinsella sp.]MDY5080657.1 ATP-binding cassette domain-containing protein [Collinsella sp.]MDY5437847.1 ATP-binding cassette domain-containing protein [Collinsella sp.]
MSRTNLNSSTTLVLSHITYAYPGSAMPALDNVSATFAPGWHGIVGDNGCGKSTFVRIACGLLIPDRGVVSPRLVSAYCAQEAGVEPPMLFDFACDFAPATTHLRRMLRITDDMLWRFSELSGGEQKKIQIAVALWQNPDLLAMDEPTNHVDAECRRQICKALAEYKGIGLLVSHDRALLDSLANDCLCFESGHVTMRPGNYSQARSQANLERESAARAKSIARSEEKRMKAEYIRRVENASRSASKRSARHVDPKDHDAKARIKLAIYTGRDGVAGKLASRMDSRIQRAQAAVDAHHVEKRYESTLWMEAQPSPRKTLIHVSSDRIPCGPRQSLRVPEIYLGNTDHLGISGPNGAGKTTLVKHILEILEGRKATGLDIRTLYIPQEVDDSSSIEFLSEIKDLPQAERGALLSIVAQLNSDPERILSGENISPGELRKLMLARGILDAPEIIVMDEPTNHLDLHSVEALERALSAFPGALVLVSHDEQFLSASCPLRLDLAPEEEHTIGQPLL